MKWDNWCDTWHVKSVSETITIKKNRSVLDNNSMSKEKFAIAMSFRQERTQVKLKQKIIVTYYACRQEIWE